MSWRRVLFLAALAHSGGRRAALAAPLATSATPDFAVKCWRVVTSSSSGVSIAATAVDNDCPMDVDIVDLTGSFAPGDDVPAIWTVSLLDAASTSNDIAMPLPPTATFNGASYTQISSTYVRSCDTIDTCDPTSLPSALSAVQTGNFSSNGNPTTFSSITGLRFAADGEYPIAAFVTVVDSENASIAYMFASYSSVKISSDAANSPTVSHEEGVVRCRMTRESALNTTLDAAASVSESDRCELLVALSPLQVVRSEGSLDVSWSATLHARADADIHLPSPLSTADVNGTAYEVVASYAKLCRSESLCDEYTADVDLAQVVSAGPTSFSSSGIADFTAPAVTVPSIGRHTAMLHMVLAGPARRYDFMYYFELVATASDLGTTIDNMAYTANGNASYCWDVLASGTQRSGVTTSSVSAVGENTDCPYVASLSMDNTTVASGQTLNLTWTISTTTDVTSSQFNATNLTTVYDAASKQWVTLPTLNVYACGEGTVCTPFETNKTLLFQAPAQNLTNGSAVIRANGLNLSAPGTYTLMAHSVFPNGASRVDTAVLSVVTVEAAAVEAAASSTSHTVAYVLVAVGAVVAAIAIFFGVIGLRKRHHRRRMEKLVQFGMFGAPATRPPTLLKTTESVQSDHTGHGSFSFVRAAPSPFGLDSPRDGSLSYDPYRRSSFHEMSLEESNLSFAFTENDRPSDLVYNV